MADMNEAIQEHVILATLNSITLMNLPDGLMCRLHVLRSYSVVAGLPFFSVIELSVARMTCSWIASFMSAIDGAVCSAPVYLGRMSLPACSSERFCLSGSACCVEMTIVWIFFG